MGHPLLVGQPPTIPADTALAYDDAFNTRDWERLASLYADDFEVEDRRPGFGSVMDKDAHINNHRVGLDLIPDMRSTTDTLQTVGDVTLWEITYRGSDNFENPVEVKLIVINGWRHHSDRALAFSASVYEESQLAEARAEIERLAAGG